VAAFRVILSVFLAAPDETSSFIPSFFSLKKRPTLSFDQDRELFRGRDASSVAAPRTPKQIILSLSNAFLSVLSYDRF